MDWKCEPLLQTQSATLQQKCVEIGMHKSMQNFPSTPITNRRMLSYELKHNKQQE